MAGGTLFVIKCRNICINTFVFRMAHCAFGFLAHFVVGRSRRREDGIMRSVRRPTKLVTINALCREIIFTKDGLYPACGFCIVGVMASLAALAACKSCVRAGQVTSIQCRQSRRPGKYIAVRRQLGKHGNQGNCDAYKNYRHSPALLTHGTAGHTWRH